MEDGVEASVVVVMTYLIGGERWLHLHRRLEHRRREKGSVFLLVALSRSSTRGEGSSLNRLTRPYNPCSNQLTKQCPTRSRQPTSRPGPAGMGEPQAQTLPIPV
ncbi:hypothetical protein V6N13_017247 [Hibiscus sabdariffa]